MKNVTNPDYNIELSDINTTPYETLQDRKNSAHTYACVGGSEVVSNSNSNSNSNVNKPGRSTDDTGIRAGMEDVKLSSRTACILAIIGTILLCVLTGIITGVVVHAVVSAKNDDGNGRCLQYEQNVDPSPSAGIEDKLASLHEELETLKNNSNKEHQEVLPGWTTYVRWGRTTCSAGAERVYKGYIGGKRYDATGSGSDSLCLPADPTWLNYTDGVFHHSAHIYGAELDVWDPNNFFDYSVFNGDMQCAVCSVHKSTTIMIPARKNCYNDWTMEYNGYLVSTHNSHPGSYNHMCMDRHPEVIPNSATDDNEHVLYLVEARCGSLKCPPYADGRELSCVVCSK